MVKDRRHVENITRALQHVASTNRAVSLQAIYPATSRKALLDDFSKVEREAHAASMRQAVALLRWAHKFGAAHHLQRAECFLQKRVQLMIAVRALNAAHLPMSLQCKSMVIIQRSGLLQKERDFFRSPDYDVLFECWVVADRLSLHAVAAECEWALTMTWEEEDVYTRAATELSPCALQRIARSLCQGMSYARSQERTERVDEYFMKRYKVAESPDLGAVAQERRGAGCVTGKKEDLMLRTLRSCW